MRIFEKETTENRKLTDTQTVKLKNVLPKRNNKVFCMRTEILLKLIVHLYH